MKKRKEDWQMPHKQITAYGERDWVKVFLDNHICPRSCSFSSLSRASLLLSLFTSLLVSVWLSSCLSVSESLFLLFYLSLWHSLSLYLELLSHPLSISLYPLYSSKRLHFRPDWSGVHADGATVAPPYYSDAQSTSALLVMASSFCLLCSCGSFAPASGWRPWAEMHNLEGFSNAWFELPHIYSTRQYSTVFSGSFVLTGWLQVDYLKKFVEILTCTLKFQWLFKSILEALKFFD